ncbi:MAG: helix-turn-helix domain-containing protein, partial [Xanthobacteraceae bacterium]
MNPSTLLERWLLTQALNADPKLSASAKSVAVALLGFVNSKTGECFPPFEKIAARCHVSKRTVARATRDLEWRGWVRIERDEGGDRNSNRYHFAFDRIRRSSEAFKPSEAPEKSGAESMFHGENLSPCSEVPGAKSAPSMVPNPTVHGAKSTPELEEELEEGNSIKRAHDYRFDSDQLPETPPFDFERWWTQKFWPQYPLQVDEIAAKKLCRATIEGRRGDGLKATPDELVAGELRFA